VSVAQTLWYKLFIYVKQNNVMLSRLRKLFKKNIAEQLKQLEIKPSVILEPPKSETSPQAPEPVITNSVQSIRTNTQPERKMIPLENVDITLDINEVIHYAKHLTLAEKYFLESYGFVLGSFHDFEKGRQQDYYVKKNHPESIMHTFYVEMIYQEILAHTDKVKKYRTCKPDIVFTNSVRQEIAIEVELGHKVHCKSRKEYHNQKFAEQIKKYGNRCYIFIPRVILKNSYKRHGLTILTRKNIMNFIQLQFSGVLNSYIEQRLDSADSTDDEI